MEHKPNPNLAPVGKGPYYAAKIQMGDLGTFAGIGVNERYEVTTEEGTAIPGLIAVGAAAVSVFLGRLPGIWLPHGPRPGIRLPGRKGHHQARSRPRRTASGRRLRPLPVLTGRPARRFEGVRKQDAQ